MSNYYFAMGINIAGVSSEMVQRQIRQKMCLDNLEHRIYVLAKLSEPFLTATDVEMLSKLCYDTATRTLASNYEMVVEELEHCYDILSSGGTWADVQDYAIEQNTKHAT